MSVPRAFNLQRVETWFVVMTFNTQQNRILRNSRLKIGATIKNLQTLYLLADRFFKLFDSLIKGCRHR